MIALIRNRRLWAGLGLLLLTLVLGYAAVRPFHLRWGATAEEVAGAMPGDLPGRRWTRAITIDAPPEAVWPWLAQWGQGRGGWYSYDWLENLLGFDIHTADRILPEHQQPQVGDPICMARGVCVSEVFVVEPQRFFGWQSLDPEGEPGWTFILGLYPSEGGRTRMVMRESFSPTLMPPPAMIAMEIPDAVMGVKALHTVKARAEGTATGPLTTALEILLWFGALLPGLGAGILVLRRAAWQAPLALGLLAILFLLGITFLYPPLWLRALLDAGLLAGLFWVAKR